MNLGDGGNTVTDTRTDAMKDRCQVMAGRWREAGDRDVVSNLPRVMEQMQGKGVILSGFFFSCISPLDRFQIHQKAQPSSETFN